MKENQITIFERIIIKFKIKIKFLWLTTDEGIVSGEQKSIEVRMKQ